MRHIIIPVYLEKICFALERGAVQAVKTSGAKILINYYCRIVFVSSIFVKTKKRELELIHLNPEIFRESDIRGIAEKDLHPLQAERIGKAIGTFLRRKGGTTLTLGRDVRPSSELIHKYFSEGILSTGCKVIDVGVLPTPVSYFAQYYLDTDAGVMITGSHNPTEFNGFKIAVKKNSLYGNQIQELRRIIEKEDFEQGKGHCEQASVLENYIAKIVSLVNIDRPLKVAVDGGNGCFGIVGPAVLKKLGMELEEIFCEPDGSFPNHHPDPTVAENLIDLQSKVRSKDFNLGMGFDGDMDRLGVVDEKGNIVWGDMLLLLFAKEILKNNSGASIVGEVKCSVHLYREIEKLGGKGVMSAAGHSLIKKRLRETRALLAGEMSGHFFFADKYYGFDDALYAGCRLLEILSKSDEPLSEMFEGLPITVSTPELRLPCPENVKFRIVKDLAKIFREWFDVVEIDGIRINFPDGWALIRASNTQPVLTLRFEADTQPRLKEIQEMVQEYLINYEPFADLNLV